MARDELILHLDKVEEVLNDYYSLPFYIISIDEIYFHIIVPKMAYPLIVVIYKRYIDQVVYHACYRLVYSRRFCCILRDYFSCLASNTRFIGR
jgi:hypothetical protein